MLSKKEEKLYLNIWEEFENFDDITDGSTEANLQKFILLKIAKLEEKIADINPENFISYEE